MKKIMLISASIMAFASFCAAANGFKEGNKLYLSGKYQDALNQYQEFIHNNPDYYEGFFNAGNALFRQEQYDAALNMYKKAQELNPKDPDVQYNIDLTQKKIKEKQDSSQNSKGKSQKEDQNKQQGKNGQQQQGKNSQQQQGQQQQSGKQQGQKSGQTPNSEPKTSSSPPSGMTEDEVQALLNQKQNQEKQLQGYFGKQYQKQGQEKDMFNMSPQEIMQYMMQRQMDPNAEPQQQGGGGNKKDW